MTWALMIMIMNHCNAESNVGGYVDCDDDVADDNDDDDDDDDDNDNDDKGFLRGGRP